MRYEVISLFNSKKFKRALGISREFFEILVSVLDLALKQKHKKGGRVPKLSVENILVLYLTYYRDYPTFLSLGITFNLNEANAFRWVKWCEKIIKDAFSKEISELSNFEKLNVNHEQIVDVTECSIQRPKNKEIQREYYSGKKKKHTIKIQIIIDEKTNAIVGVSFDKGHVHDFTMFKNTTTSLDDKTPFLADSGYQGIMNLFKNSLTPKKKSKNNSLTTEEQELNNLISSTRIPVEHVNCQIKIFRILSEKYRSRRETLGLRALLICCFYNFCL